MGAEKFARAGKKQADGFPAGLFPFRFLSSRFACSRRAAFVEAKSAQLCFRLWRKLHIRSFLFLPPRQTLRWFTSEFYGGRGKRLGLCFAHPQNRTTQHLCLSGRLHVLRRSSPRAISTGQLHALLHFHLRPINQVVFLGPYSIKDERSHLRGGFTLRCLQRLSRPYIATQLCRWHDNWCTRGTSIPVLSY